MGQKTPGQRRLHANYTLLSILIITLFTLSIYVYERTRADKENLRPHAAPDIDLLEDYDDPKFSHPVKFWDEALNLCKWPVLSPSESEISGYLDMAREMRCGTDMEQLASLLSDGRLLLARPKKSRNVKCFAAPLSGALAPNTKMYSIGDEVELSFNEPLQLPFEQYAVKCLDSVLVAVVNGSPKTEPRLVYAKTFANFNQKLAAAPAGQPPPAAFKPATPLAPSLVIIVLDSTSLNQFKRHAPETYAFLNEHRFITMNMYNKVADNSAVNLLPVLAGRPIQTDPKNPDPEDAFVDLEKVTFLWDIMKKRGCVTLLNDDISNVRRGLFHYPARCFRGFSKKPTHFYLRPLHTYNVLTRIQKDALCMTDGTLAAHEYLAHAKRFSLAFKNTCHFSFSFITELTHGDPSNLGLIDRQLREALEALFAAGMHEHTAIAVMGDHGNRLFHMQKTTTGRVEERSPLFSIRLPTGWIEQNRLRYKNLRTNANRLISNFDVHQTLRHIALAGAVTAEPPPARGLDLFEHEVSTNRTCEDALVPPNFCLCMEKLELKSRTHANESEMYKRFVGHLSDVVLALPCVQHVRPHFGFPTLNFYSISQMALHGIRYAPDYEKVANTTVTAAIQWVEIGLLADMKPRSDGKLLSFGVEARYRLHTQTGEFELAGSPRITGRTVECNAPTIDQVCEMCFFDNLIAASNEEHISP